MSTAKLIEPTLKGIYVGYKKELELYQRFFEISRRQMNLDEAKDIDEIKSYLAEKQDILDNVEKVEKEIIKAKNKIVSVLEVDEFTISNLNGKVESETLEYIRIKLKEIGSLILSIEKMESKSQMNLNNIINITKK